MFVESWHKGRAYFKISESHVLYIGFFLPLETTCYYKRGQTRGIKGFRLLAEFYDGDVFLMGNFTLYQVSDWNFARNDSEIRISFIDDYNHFLYKMKSRFLKKAIMDQTHIHLLITHLPIFGSILGAFVLAYGLWTKSDQTKVAAYILLIISSIGAVLGYLTGEAAEETVENIAGVSKDLVEQHEEFALIALVSLIVLGLASVAGLFLTSRKSLLTRVSAVIVLLVSLVSFGLAARTGYLGGQIRHTEIKSNLASPADSGNSEEHN